MPVQDWNTDHTLITSLESENVEENIMTPPQVNNLFRKMAAAIRVFYNKTYRKNETVKIQPAADPAPAAPEEGDLWMGY